MGNWFVMSIRFDKCQALDFGFIQIDSERAVNPKDNSLWIKCKLYDFGWGQENGFYRVPLPTFYGLLDLVLYSNSKDDKYGAAAIILEKYAENLLSECEEYINNGSLESKFKKLVGVFNLQIPMNRCSIEGKTHDCIKCEYLRWKKISEAANKLK